MKPGDKVWMFDAAGKIECFTFDHYESEDVIIGYDNNGIMVRFCLPYPYFPTREALCEHYRKIFE